MNAKSANLNDNGSDLEDQLKLLAYFSHEIRSPLGVILGYIDLALESMGDPQTTETCLRTIQRNGVHIHKIAEEFLAVSRTRRSALEVQSEEITLIDIVSDLTDIFRFESRAKPIQFRIFSDSPVPKVLATDPMHFRQVLTNILINAIKFTETGHIDIKLKYVALPSGQRDLEFEVSDAGMGIPIDRQGRIFQRALHPNSKIARRESGSGLGLALSAKLARSLGGELYLKQSEVGRGSVFSFLLRDVRCAGESELIDIDFVFSK